MSSGNTLLAHAVGAGKTYTMAAAGMKMKQAGLIHKPMYVVPNHLLEQFAREFMQLYPNAKLLVAGKEDFTRERRKVLTAKIASGEWDGIVVTHSSFERIGMSRDYQEQFLKEQIAEYDQLLCDGASKNATRAHRNLIKTIEKQKAKREERLKDLLAEDKKDDGLVFDELGVDHIFIDEAHYFKNLETPTKMDRVAGIQTGGSERAFDLYMKARYLHQLHPGHGVTFATGTPISNTMVEMYTMQRFLDPEGLKSRGIDHFDAWAATFGEVVDTMEISPDGASLRPRSRFARFTNLPELQQMFRAFSPTCRRPRCSTCPGPSWKPARPLSSPARCRRSSTPSSRSWSARYDRSAVAEGRSAGGQRPGHHHRRPQARPRRPDAVSDGAGLPRLEGQRPGGQRRSRLAQDGSHTRHANDLLRHGRESDAVGILGLRRGDEEAGATRHPAAADRHDWRRRFRRQEAGPLREGPQRLGAGADRQHAEDGHRHQRAETPRGPAPPRRPLEAGRGRTARRPHPSPEEREQASGDLPLRHGRIVRRLYVAGPGDQGPVHLPGDDRRQRRSAAPRTSAARNSPTPRSRRSHRATRRC